MHLKDNLRNVLIYKNTSTTEHGTVALHWSTPFISEYLWNFLHWKDKLKKANRRDVTTHYGNLLSTRLVSQNNWYRTGLFISSKRLFVLLYRHTTLITFSDVLTIFLARQRTEVFYYPLTLFCDKFWRRKNIHLTLYFSLNTYNWVWLYPTWFNGFNINISNRNVVEKLDYLDA